MKKIKYFIIIFLMFLSGCSYSSLDDGLGTEDNPYLIYTVEDFMDFGGRLYHLEDNYKDQHFKLMNDLNFLGINYNPIGANIFNSFDGHFDGNNHTLKNININGSYSYSGVFGVIGMNASVKNLNVDNYYCNNSKLVSYNGVISGAVLRGAEVSNCNIEGEIIANELCQNNNIKSASYSGGVTGFLLGEVNNVNVEVDLKGFAVGGVIGKFQNGKLSNCYYEDSKLVASYVAGGIIGYAENDNSNYIYNEYFYSKNIQIESQNIAGGAIGIGNGYLIFDNVFVSTYINIKNGDSCYVGGLLGTVKETYNISNTYVCFRKSYAEIACDIELTKVDGLAIIGMSGAYTNYIYYTVVKGYFNLISGRYAHYTTTYVSSKFIIEEKNNIGIYNKEDEMCIKSSSLDENIIYQTLKYDPSWMIKEDNYYYVKSDKEIFSTLQGEGTQDNPYLIHNFNEYCYLFVSENKKYFKLMNDIDMEGKGSKDKNFIQYTSTFYLDGKNYRILNYDIGYGGGGSNGVLGDLKDSSVKNLKFENLTINLVDNQYSSINRYLFGTVRNSIIENIDIEFNFKTKDLTLEFHLYELLNNSTLNNININGQIDHNKSIEFYAFYNQITSSTISNIDFNMNIYNSESFTFYPSSHISEGDVLVNNQVNLHGINVNKYSMMVYYNSKIYNEDELSCYYNDEKVYPINK